MSAEGPEVCTQCGSDAWATDDAGKWRCAECGLLSPRMYGEESLIDRAEREEMDERFGDDDSDYDDDEYEEVEGRDCFHCGGDGWVECDAPIECTSPHNEFGECRCSSCNGSGLAKDMTIW